jgi:hypothetical protein
MSPPLYNVPFSGPVINGSSLGVLVGVLVVVVVLVGVVVLVLVDVVVICVLVLVLVVVGVFVVVVLVVVVVVVVLVLVLVVVLVLVLVVVVVGRVVVVVVLVDSSLYSLLKVIRYNLLSITTVSTSPSIPLIKVLTDPGVLSLSMYLVPFSHQSENRNLSVNQFRFSVKPPPTILQPLS